MTITGGSALPKEDIERMVRDAEQFAEEDRKRREEVETRNTAESLIHQTETFMKDNADKIGERGEVDEAITALKSALEGTDSAAIRTATDTLAAASQKLGQAMYANAPQGDPASAGAQGSDDDVVDAEIVDEPPAEESA